MFKLKPWLCVLACLQAVPALAQGSMNQLLAMDLDDLMAMQVRISSHLPQPISKTPSVVSVITAKDFEATGATNLVDMLQTLPGVYVKLNLWGARPLVSFRGNEGKQALMMLNGEPMSDLIWGFGIYWKGVPASMIERVEIIRGPGSALYGANASAGVINVITKSAGATPEQEAGLRLGSFDTQEGWFQQTGKWHDFDLSIGGSLSHSNGHEPYIARDKQTASDATDGTSVSYAPGNAHYGWEGRNLHLSARRGHWQVLADYLAHNNLETGLSGAGVLVGPNDSVSDNRINLGLLYHNDDFAPNWGLSAELRYHHLSYDSGNGYQERPPGYQTTYTDGQINRQSASEHGATFELSGVYSGIRNHVIRVGAGYTWEDLYEVEHWQNYGTGPNGTIAAGSALVNLTDTAYAFAPEKSRAVTYLYAQDIWALGKSLELTAGARYDDYSDFGGTLNPRLALVWDTTPALTTKLMYGEAYRAPTFSELYSPTSFALPNANLKPEKTRTWDLLLAYAPHRDVNLSLDFYQFEEEDLIARIGSPAQYQNAGNATSQGIELESLWRINPALRLKGNFSHRRIVESSAVDYSTPKDKAYLSLDWALAPDWNWNVQANWIGARKLPAGDARAPLPDYTLTDTTLRYTPKRDWTLVLSVRNLFDVDAREYSSVSLTNNLPLPGRSLYAELRYRFGP